MNLRLTLKFEHDNNIDTQNKYSNLWGFPRFSIANLNELNRLKVQEFIENEIKKHSKEISKFIVKDMINNFVKGQVQQP